jgi:lipoyl(octanoyl) transferase
VSGTLVTSPADPAAPAGLDARWLGRVPYDDALALQARLVADRRAGRVADRLLLLEHDHVITLGTSAHREHVLLDANERRLLGIALYETGRGGDVTYHGPGQLVGYPIIDLKPDRCDLHRYVRDLETVLMHALGDFGILANRIRGLTGVWVGNRKVAAIGVRVSSGWITSHGFALNVATNLALFDAIVPCGIRDRGVTNMTLETRLAPTMREVAECVHTHFCAVFGRTASRLRDASANPTGRT